jgi:hydrogenase nickel incorporation protein HypA/HybF
MHEMALAESVREIVIEAARGNGARRVSAVRLEIGKLAQVEVDAMRFAFDVVMRGSLAESARLEIVQADGSAWCMRCSKPVAIARRGNACPACDSHQLQLTGGERMRVLEIEVE